MQVGVQSKEEITCCNCLEHHALETGRRGRGGNLEVCKGFSHTAGAPQTSATAPILSETGKRKEQRGLSHANSSCLANSVLTVKF